MPRASAVLATSVSRMIHCSLKLLDGQSEPMANPCLDARTQDNYIEDRFEIPASAQHAFRVAAETANGGYFRLPRELERLVVSNAYLGMLDVNPMGGQFSGGETTAESIDIWGQASGRRIGIDIPHYGERRASPVCKLLIGQKDDGRLWEHKIDLEWKGYTELGESGFRNLNLIANGEERLRWGNRSDNDSDRARPAVATTSRRQAHRFRWESSLWSPRRVRNSG